jgi:hypothetical protein
MDLLDTTLLDALKRKPKKLAFEAVYIYSSTLAAIAQSGVLLLSSQTGLPLFQEMPIIINLYNY